MRTEIEAKFRIGEPAPIRAMLERCGAIRLSFVHELNHLLDTPERRILAAGCGLRVRVWRSLDDEKRSGATLTFKGPRHDGEFKSHPEIETALTDADDALAILEHIGFRATIVYEKRRETWRLGECEVTLDELPRLGWFLEIEGPDADAIQSARHQLGLADTPVVDETYVRMAARYGDSTERGTRQLVFGPPGQPETR